MKSGDHSERSGDPAAESGEQLNGKIGLAGSWQCFLQKLKTRDAFFTRI